MSDDKQATGVTLLQATIDRLQSPHADKIFVAKEYTKADLIRDLIAVLACVKS